MMVSSRTTVTLEDDVMGTIQSEMRRRGVTFKQAVNELIRRGAISKPPSRPPRYKPKVLARGLRPGINLDCTSRLLDELEGPWRR
jgi:hypothetical protein